MTVSTGPLFITSWHEFEYELFISSLMLNRSLDLLDACSKQMKSNILHQLDLDVDIQIKSLVFML